ncbi:MAG: hypothetical protein ACRC5R_04030 [Mycoplasmatales bacterium]
MLSAMKNERSEICNCVTLPYALCYIFSNLWSVSGIIAEVAIATGLFVVATRVIFLLKVATDGASSLFFTVIIGFFFLLMQQI